MKKVGMGCLAALGLVFLLAVIGSMSTTSTDTAAATGKPEFAIKPLPESPPAVPGAQWDYSHDADPMTSKTAHYASVSSSNTVNFDSPYSGDQHASLTLRSHPRMGKNVILRIEKGQILCTSYDGCEVLVRFDDGAAQTFSAAAAADHSSETIFISNYPRFVQALAKAKRARVSFPVYQEGNPVFDFDVSGFSAKQYLATP